MGFTFYRDVALKPLPKMHNFESSVETPSGSIEQKKKEQKFQNHFSVSVDMSLLPSMHMGIAN